MRPLKIIHVANRAERYKGARSYGLPYRINNGGKDYHFSIQKLKDHFQYKPKTELETALQKTVEWYNLHSTHE